MRGLAFRRLLCAAAALAAGVAASALPAAAAAPQPPAPASAPAPAASANTVRPSTALPLDATFIDAQGRPLRLADAFADGRPAVLTFGAWRCTELCGLAMHGLLEALDAGGLPRRAYRILGISIDPADTVADAQAREAVYLAYAAHLHQGRPTDAPPDLHLLVGAPASAADLARIAGFGVTGVAQETPVQRAQVRLQQPSSSRASPVPVHAAGFVVLTPDGRLSRRFDGVRYDAGELRLALVKAGAGHVDAGGSGRIGDPGIGQRLLLLCTRAVSTHGGRAEAALDFVRYTVAALALALGGWIWCHRRSSPARRTPPSRRTPPTASP